MLRRIVWPCFPVQVLRVKWLWEFRQQLYVRVKVMARRKPFKDLFHRPEFRIYRSTDILGVEYGGALKNVIAIAAGVGDGLGYGDNTKAGLVTRALSEMRRLGVACGAQADTFAGLSGLGDLMLTCFSKQSRNRDLGERLRSRREH